MVKELNISIRRDKVKARMQEIDRQIQIRKDELQNLSYTLEKLAEEDANLEEQEMKESGFTGKETYGLGMP